MFCFVLLCFVLFCFVFLSFVLFCYFICFVLLFYSLLLFLFVLFLLFLLFYLFVVPYYSVYFIFPFILFSHLFSSLLFLSVSCCCFSRFLDSQIVYPMLRHRNGQTHARTARYVRYMYRRNIFYCVSDSFILFCFLLMLLVRAPVLTV